MFDVCVVLGVANNEGFPICFWKISYIRGMNMKECSSTL